MSKTKLTEFINGIHANSRGYLEQHPDLAQLLEAIDEAFGLLLSVQALRGHGSVIFVAMAQGSYLSAVQLATSGQLPPSYMTSRGLLEASLYGWYITKRPELKHVWSSRHIDEQAKKLVRKSFKIAEMRDALRAVSDQMENQFGTAYETVIDLGAHPNSLALWTNLSDPDIEGFHTLHYVNIEEPARLLAVHGAAFSALTALLIAALTFRDELVGSGVSERVIELQNALLARLAE